MSGIFLICLIVMLHCFVAFADWIPLNVTEIKLPADDDQVDIYLLVAPLMQDLYGDLLTTFNMYHANIGFVNKNTGYSWSTEFDGLPTMMSAMKPEVKHLDNGMVDLVWKAHGGAMLYSPINNTYWKTLRQVVATVDGATHNKFFHDFIIPINATHPFYHIENVRNSKERSSKFQHSYECWDYAWEVLRYFKYKLGVSSVPDYLKKCDFSYYADAAPVQVELMASQELNDEISTFFELTNFMKEELTIEKVVEGVKDLVANRIAFYHFNSTYFKFHLAKPYISYSYDFEKI